MRNTRNFTKTRIATAAALVITTMGVGTVGSAIPALANATIPLPISVLQQQVGHASGITFNNQSVVSGPTGPFGFPASEGNNVTITLSDVLTKDGIPAVVDSESSTPPGSGVSGSAGYLVAFCGNFTSNREGGDVALTGSDVSSAEGIAKYCIPADQSSPLRPTHTVFGADVVVTPGSAFVPADPGNPFATPPRLPANSIPAVLPVYRHSTNLSATLALTLDHGVAGSSGSALIPAVAPVPPVTIPAVTAVAAVAIGSTFAGAASVPATLFSPFIPAQPPVPAIASAAVPGSAAVPAGSISAGTPLIPAVSAVANREGTQCAATNTVIPCLVIIADLTQSIAFAMPMVNATAISVVGRAGTYNPATGLGLCNPNSLTSAPSTCPAARLTGPAVVAAPSAIPPVAARAAVTYPFLFGGAGFIPSSNTPALGAFLPAAGTTGFLAGQAQAAGAAAGAAAAAAGAAGAAAGAALAASNAANTALSNAIVAQTNDTGSVSLNAAAALAATAAGTAASAATAALNASNLAVSDAATALGASNLAASAASAAVSAATAAAAASAADPTNAALVTAANTAAATATAANTAAATALAASNTAAALVVTNAALLVTANAASATAAAASTTAANAVAASVASALNTAAVAAAAAASAAAALVGPADVALAAANAANTATPAGAPGTAAYVAKATATAIAAAAATASVAAHNASTSAAAASASAASAAAANTSNAAVNAAQTAANAALAALNTANATSAAATATATAAGAAATAAGAALGATLAAFGAGAATLTDGDNLTALSLKVCSTPSNTTCFSGPVAAPAGFGGSQLGVDGGGNTGGMIVIGRTAGITTGDKFLQATGVHYLVSAGTCASVGAATVIPADAFAAGLPALSICSQTQTQYTALTIMADAPTGLAFSPGSGAPGTVGVLTGSSYEPRATVSIQRRDVNGKLVGAAITTTTSSTGGLSVTFAAGALDYPVADVVVTMADGAFGATLPSQTVAFDSAGAIAFCSNSDACNVGELITVSVLPGNVQMSAGDAIVEIDAVDLSTIDITDPESWYPESAPGAITQVLIGDMRGANGGFVITGTVSDLRGATQASNIIPAVDVFMDDSAACEAYADAGEGNDPLGSITAGAGQAPVDNQGASLLADGSQEFCSVAPDGDGRAAGMFTLDASLVVAGRPITAVDDYVGLLTLTITGN